MTDHPTCQAKRPHKVFVGAAKGQPARFRTETRCGALLWADGCCWFCGHVDRAVRRQWKKDHPGQKPPKRPYEKSRGNTASLDFVNSTKGAAA